MLYCLYSSVLWILCIFYGIYRQKWCWGRGGGRSLYIISEMCLFTFLIYFGATDWIYYLWFYIVRFVGIFCTHVDVVTRAMFTETYVPQVVRRPCAEYPNSSGPRPVLLTLGAGSIFRAPAQRTRDAITRAILTHVLSRTELSLECTHTDTRISSSPAQISRREWQECSAGVTISINIITSFIYFYIHMIYTYYFTHTIYTSVLRSDD